MYIGKVKRTRSYANPDGFYSVAFMEPQVVAMVFLQGF